MSLLEDAANVSTSDPLDPSSSWAIASNRANFRGGAVLGLDTVAATRWSNAIQDATSSHGVVDLGIKLPWELPGMDLVFGSGSLHGMPADASERILLEVPIPLPCPPGDPQQDAPPAIKRPRVMLEGHIFHRAVNFAETASEDQLTQRRWDRALEKCYVIICQNKACSLIGSDIHGRTMQKALVVMKELFGRKSAATALKRGYSLIKSMDRARKTCA